MKGFISCFSVIEHRRRMILHVNMTREPTPAWVGPNVEPELPR